MKIEIKKLSDKAKTPTQGSSFAAGFDLYAAESCTIHNGYQKLIKTDISLNIPGGYYGRIAPRSGLAFKNRIDVMGGVIDSDYTGNIGVILRNHDNSEFFQVEEGDRIAQIIFEKIADNVSFEEVEELNQTERGSGGYGSSGTK